MKQRIKYIEPKKYLEIKSKSKISFHFNNPIKCAYPNCISTFNDNSEYSKHLDSHYNTNLQCPYPHCSIKFNAFSRLKRHLTVHSNQKIFLCPICNKGFKLDYNMKAHLNKHFIPKKKKVYDTQLQRDIDKCTLLIRNIFKDVLKNYSLTKHNYK